MAYQLVKVGKEQKKDFERALFLNQARDSGSVTGIRKMAGLGAWIKTNDTQLGAGGASPTGDGTDAPSPWVRNRPRGWVMTRNAPTSAMTRWAPKRAPRASPRSC